MLYMHQIDGLRKGEAVRPMKCGPERRWPLVSAALLAGVLAAAALMDATPRDATLFGIQGPPCALRALAGENACPGCGLTRSTALTVHGRLAEAVRVHPAGPLVALLCALGLLVYLHAVVRGRMEGVHLRLIGLGRKVFVVGLAAGWLVRLLVLRN